MSLSVTNVYIPKKILSYLEEESLYEIKKLIVQSPKYKLTGILNIYNNFLKLSFKPLHVTDLSARSF